MNFVFAFLFNCTAVNGATSWMMLLPETFLDRWRLAICTYVSGRVQRRPFCGLIVLILQIAIELLLRFIIVCNFCVLLWCFIDDVDHPCAEWTYIYILVPHRNQGRDIALVKLVLASTHRFLLFLYKSITPPKQFKRLICIFPKIQQPIQELSKWQFQTNIFGKKLYVISYGLIYKAILKKALIKFGELVNKFVMNTEMCDLWLFYTVIKCSV